MFLRGDSVPWFNYINNLPESNSKLAPEKSIGLEDWKMSMMSFRLGFGLFFKCEEVVSL